MANKLYHCYRFGFVFLVAACFLLIATKSSPLYPLNDWVDANAIFTVGKSMMDGKIVYKDIFEQKGPALYLIHGMGSLVAHNSFFGIYLMEVLAFFFFLWYIKKILELYLSKNFVNLGVIFTAFFILNLTNFVHGDSAEEYCLPLLAISMFHLIRYLKNYFPAKIPLRTIFLNGFLAGCVVWIKYSMIGYWFGWMLVLLFGLILIKHYLYTLKVSLVFLLGMGLSAIPWVLYFHLNDGLDSFIEVYFLTNIKYYASSTSLVMNLITISGKIILVYFKENLVFAILLLTGLIGLLFTKKIEVRWLLKAGIIVPFIFLFLSVYGGGIRLDYYFQIFTPLIIFGIIFIFKIIQGSAKSLIEQYSTSILIAVFSILFAVMFLTHHNTYFMKYEKNDLFQYQFADYLNRYRSPSLLNYGFLDVGVYNTANIEPTTYYFMKHNFDYEVYPFDVDALNDYVENGLVDFVVLRSNTDTEYNNPHLDGNYEKVLQQEQFYEGMIHNYLLYKKKGLAEN